MESLRNFFRRTNQKILQGLGIAKATEDEIFEHGVQEVRNLKRFTEGLNPLLQVLTRKLRSTSKALFDVAQFFSDAFEHDSDRMHNPAHAWIEAVGCFSEIVDKFEESIVENAISPLQEYVEQWKALEDKIKVRKNALLDYDARRRKLEASEKKGDMEKSISRREKTRVSKERYDEWNSEVTNHVHDLLLKKCEFFDPLFLNLYSCSTHAFDCFVKTLNQHCGKNMDKLLSEQNTYDYEAQYAQSERSNRNSMNLSSSSSTKSISTQGIAAPWAPQLVRVSVLQACGGPRSGKSTNEASSSSSVSGPSTSSYTEEADEESTVSTTSQTLSEKKEKETQDPIEEADDFDGFVGLRNPPKPSQRVPAKPSKTSKPRNSVNLGGVRSLNSANQSSASVMKMPESVSRSVSSAPNSSPSGSSNDFRSFDDSFGDSNDWGDWSSDRKDDSFSAPVNMSPNMQVHTFPSARNAPVASMPAPGINPILTAPISYGNVSQLQAALKMNVSDFGSTPFDELDEDVSAPASQIDSVPQQNSWDSEFGIPKPMYVPSNPQKGETTSSAKIPDDPFEFF